jgi:photosystem II stability/assembly factor-like uncharacterized protein
MTVRSKKNLLSLALCVSLFPASTPVSQAAEQWRRLPGPGGASIDALFSHGDYLFAGGDTGIYRSTDQGQSWKSVNLRGSDQFPHITSFTAVGGTIFAGSSDQPMFRSTDNGLTWTRMEVPEDITTFFHSDVPIAITALASIGGSLFAGTKCSSHAPIPCGIHRSTDNGKTWTRVGKGVADTSVRSLAVIGAELFAGGGFAGGGVLISRDNGLSWTPSNAGLNKENYVNAFAVKDGRIYLAGNGVYVSSDGGRSWAPINDGLTELDVRGLIVNDTHIFATTYHGWLFARRL